MSNSGGSPNGNEESQNSESSSSNSGSSSSNSESSSSNSESSSSNSESSSSNSNSGSSSPPSGENSSPSDSSSNSPPSQDGPSSDSNSESSSSKSGSSSSPSESNSSPPSSSGSSSSPPNSDSGSSPSPPPPQSQSNSNSNSPPSESSEGSNSSPSNSNPNSSPSQSSEGSNSSPSNSNSSPSASEGSQSQSPPTNSHKSSDNQQSGNPSRESPNSQTSHNSPPSLSSRTSDRVPELSPPSTHSTHSSSTPTSRSSTRSSDSSDNSSAATVAGITAAGVLVIALISLLFVITRKKKRRTQDYYDPYGPPPPNFSVNADGYYYGPQYSQQQRQQHSQQHPQQHSQQYSMGMNSQEYYGAKPPPAPVGIYSSGSYRGPESGVLGGSKSCFTYEELMGITEGFSRKNVIGEGGFGAVYKGSLPDGKLVAVKQLKAGSGQGEREFRAEVEIISRVHHRHLVSLVGYCVAETQRLLVYEFVPNNTLEHHLHGQGVPMMEWSKRLKIAVGAARGLAYLHEDCHPKIIHRDIKSANILIDDVFEAQVADFGLARLSNDTSTHVSTRVMGTFGYMAPEYASSGKLTDRSDVFSFGVVLLELVTGRKPIDQDLDESLVEWARPVLQQARETGDYSELVDPRLEKRYVEEELIRMAETAAACVRHSAPKRPRMVQVLRALDTDGDMPDISNGVKVGQSTIFECGPNSDLQKFRMMAFGSDESSEYDMCSANFNSREMSTKPSSSWKSADSGELETRPINPRRGY